MDTSRTDTFWYVLLLNPEPWRVGPISAGRGKGGKIFPIVGRNRQLADYQEAVREELKRQRAEKVQADAYELIFVFHQVIEKYESANGRMTQDKKADLTNLVKATEDAIQDILIDNDVKVEKQTNYVQRSESQDATPYVIIGLAPYLGFNPLEISSLVWDELDRGMAEQLKERQPVTVRLPEQDVF